MKAIHRFHSRWRWFAGKMADKRSTSRITFMLVCLAAIGGLAMARGGVTVYRTDPPVAVQQAARSHAPATADTSLPSGTTIAGIPRNHAKLAAAPRPAPAPVVAPHSAPSTAPPKVGSDGAPTSILAQLMEPGRFAYHATVRRIARRYSVETRLVMAIIASESKGDPAAVSPAGAIGLMQLMPATAADLGVDPWDPEQNLEGAVRYLASQLSTFKSVDLSLVAYNAGPVFAQRYVQGQAELGAETRGFLMRVGELLH